MEAERKLTAIMFTDIVGYTAMMQKDETKAVLFRDRHRESFRRLHEKYKGEILQYYGDGTLSIFNSSVQAVQCGVALQQEMLKFPHLPLRIGIHVGDIIKREEEVIGDAVNLASRIESLAVAGSVLISHEVQHHIKNHGISTRSLGKFQLKNIIGPTEVFAIDLEGLVIPTQEQMEEKGQIFDRRSKIESNSIAVLPFANMSSDPEQEYFCEGLAEELLNILTQIKNLKVASRTSAFAFKGKNQDISLIGEKLRVRNVLEGSIRKVGSRIRLTAQLVDVTNGYHLWSEKYDRQLDDIFAIQDELAQAIAERLNLTFGADPRESVDYHSTENFQAYDSYLKGRYILHRMDASVQDALELFQTAIDLDPNFALAHMGVGDTLRAMGHQGMIKPTEVSMQANAALDHALNLNPKLAEAYVTKAWISTFYDWDIVQAEKHFLKALQLNPNSDVAHARY
ncbi:MAG: hypothetical protein HKN76_20805, partial [Saprospiraceae bacterium]|nr:hypothetical protein [Saprospiraceae bacterium]